jgi:PAS domain-containing protein
MLDNIDFSEQHRLEDFAMISNGWFWETNTECQFVYISNNIQSVTGNPSEFYLGKPHSELRDSTGSNFWSVHFKLLEGRKNFNQSVLMDIGPTGVKWIRCSGRPVFGTDGGFRGFRGVCGDITNQTVSGDKGELLAEAVEQFSEAFALWGPDERMVICNRRFRELNFQVADYIKPGSHFVDHVRAAVEIGLTDPENMSLEDWVDYRLEQFRAPGRPFELRRQDGTWFWIIEQRLANDSVVTTATNITAVKNAEIEVARTHRRLEDAIEALPAGVVLYDNDDNLVMTNSQFRESFGADACTAPRL